MLYLVQRRYSDFEWLHNQIETNEKFRFCNRPQLPAKKLVNKTNEEFVEKRGRDLQLYLRILMKDTEIKHAEPLRIFLTCNNYDEFEKYKRQHPITSLTNTSMTIPVELFKNLQIIDGIKSLFNSAKSTFIDTLEPTEFQITSTINSLMDKITKYAPFINKSIESIEENIEFYKRQAKNQHQIIDCIKDWQLEETPSELNSIFETIEGYHTKNGALYEVFFYLKNIDKTKN